MKNFSNAPHVKFQFFLQKNKWSTELFDILKGYIGRIVLRKKNIV